jgi:hypothetical protein
VLTALDAAEVLARRDAPGDAARAAVLVEGVEQDARQQGMAAAAARAASLRARLRGGECSSNGRAATAPAPHATLRREQDVWRLDYEGRSAVLADAKGLHHLAALLASPGMPIAAVRLAAGNAHAIDLDSGRARAAELREELDEARTYNDPERIAHVNEALARLAAELSDAVVTPGPAAERARLNVTRAIRTAIGRIAVQEPELGHLLQSAIRTGSSCAYEPDPGMALTWEVRA